MLPGLGAPDEHEEPHDLDNSASPMNSDVPMPLPLPMATMVVSMNEPHDFDHAVPGSPCPPPTQELPQLPHCNIECENRPSSPPGMSAWANLSGTSGVQLEIRQELELFFQSSLRHEFVNLGTRIKQDVRILLEEMKFQPSAGLLRPTLQGSTSLSRMSRPSSGVAQSERAPSGSQEPLARMGSELEGGDNSRRLSTFGNSLNRLKSQDSSLVAHLSRPKHFGPRNYRSFMASEAIESYDVKTETKNRRLSVRAPQSTRLSQMPAKVSPELNRGASEVVTNGYRETSVVPLHTQDNRPLAIHHSINFGNSALEVDKRAFEEQTRKSVQWASEDKKRETTVQAAQWTSQGVQPIHRQTIMEQNNDDTWEPLDSQNLDSVSETEPASTSALVRSGTEPTGGAARQTMKQPSILVSGRKSRFSMIPSVTNVKENMRSIVAQLPPALNFQKPAVDISASTPERSTSDEDVSTCQSQGPDLVKSASSRLNVSTKRNQTARKAVFIGATGRFGKELKRAKTLALPASWTWRLAERIVNHICFDFFTGALVFLNSIWIGVCTDMVAQRVEDKYSPSNIARSLDLAFAILFGLELALRLFVYRCTFFTMKGKEWNWFDTVLVSLQLIEEVMFLFDTQESTSGANFSFMRVLRILRLVRVLRLVRIVRLIGELRTMIYSIISTWKSLGWTMVLLSLIIYVVGIFFTQLVLDHAMDSVQLEDKFGSVGNSLLSLFGAITGGVDWVTLVHPLIEDIHPICGLFFSFYIAFCVLAILNIVTGVFVDSALQTARRDKDVDLVNTLREVFLKTDEDNTGVIELAEFEKHIADSQMDAVFKAVDLDKTEARGLFELIDVENKGSISREDFIMGCLRLKGPAKALDLATLMFDMKRMANMMEEQFEILEHIFMDERNLRRAGNSIEGGDG